MLVLDLVFGTPAAGPAVGALGGGGWAAFCLALYLKQAPRSKFQESLVSSRFGNLGRGALLAGLGGVVGAGVRCGIGWVLFFIQQLDESCLRFEVKLDVRPWCR